MRASRRSGWAVAAVAALTAGASPAVAQHPEEARNMRLVGAHDLQGRSAYQPVIQRQGERWIAYVGHHGGQGVNTLTGATEENGTSIVDVTDPARPVYLAHIPGPSGTAEGGGAQMVQVCGIRGRTYLLRTRGNLAHEIWEVSDPRLPRLVTTVVDRLGGTHKNWWDCGSGIAYLVADLRPAGWQTRRGLKIYDLGDPARPRFIRDFGLVGTEPGSAPRPEAQRPGGSGLHEPVLHGNRLYLAYGTSANGVMQIVDVGRLLTGDPAPTPANLLGPQIGRIDMQPFLGGHTAYPVIGVEIADYARNRDHRVRDFVALASESIANQCQETRHVVSFVEITDPSRPYPVSTFQVRESSGNYCERGGRFGPHAPNWSFNPTFYRKLLFVAYFNAGVRAVDVRDPFFPREAGFYIPATNANTDLRCARGRSCPRAIQTNNVELDDRGYLYLVDRANTGLHIVELTGEARAIVDSR
jgi:hypothetical protein